MRAGLLHPELLLLLVPAAYVWWRARGGALGVRTLRALVALALVLALAAPYFRAAASGRDLVLLVDLSRSMPPDVETAALELARLAGDERRAGDRLAVVSFGGRARIEQPLAEEGELARFAADLRPDATDLGAALELALALIPGGRPGRILVVSDGENGGRDPIPAARRAFARGLPIDVRELARAREADLSVERIELPEEVQAGEPFQFSVWVRSDRRVEADFRLERGGRIFAAGRRAFEPGLTRLAFRDTLERPGVARYDFALEGGADPVPENDRAVGALRASGARRILIVNDAGAEGTLALALRKGGLAVEVAAPESARLDRVGLTAYRAVVLENVAAGRLGVGLTSLREFVSELGGGLLVTGGRASFGVGGYHRSAVDELLPVSMEMRQEQRRQGIALAIVMDRSGSMGMRATVQHTKMDLANLGAAEAIGLLSPLDSVTVIAVDTRPHVVLPLTELGGAAGIDAEVLKIQPMGGGIYVYTGLVAAARELEGAKQFHRHVILFSDAADSEEQEGCAELVAALRAANVTLSTIALGTERDVDADFLTQITAIGDGEIYFTTDSTELPRLFAQDTLTAARASFAEGPTAGRVLPGILGLGELAGLSSPTVDGYNVTYLREGASVAIATDDESAAPLLAFRQAGLGRTAALTAEIGGRYGAPLVAWEDFASLAVTLARWIAGQEEPEDVFASVRREGAHALVTVELDPDSPSRPDAARLEARIRSADGTASALVLERAGPHHYEGRYLLESEGIALGTVRLGEDRVLTLPPIALPYSPEFERGAAAGHGARLLREIARESGGALDPPVSALYSGPRTGRAYRVVSRELALAALLLVLFEIAVRRLQLLESLRLPRPLRALLAAARAALTRRAPPRGPRPHSPDLLERAVPASDVSSPAAPAAPPASPGLPLPLALTRARRAAKDRLGR